MSYIFNIIAGLLKQISEATGFTYKEINIIVYYIVIPFVYTALADKILKKHVLKVIFSIGIILVFIFIGNFRKFSEHLFDASAKFLQCFSAIGWDYITASVVICVIVPGILFVILAYYAFKPVIKK